ncbi:DUF1850 domain-containing protein [Microvirga sp. G4-2]|uniref:DUF1850 domain-containing protein n=1 Tax=Microvirga sp. G4-2 TaxID=3434467 RepID=UPI0040442A13
MICLVAGKVIAPLMAGAMTLAWTHSVEKIAWEEDWRATPAGLELMEARVKGSGAGMEPPPDARLVNGSYVWKPNLQPQAEVVMRRSGATADWRICIEGQCRPMEAYVPPQADPVVMEVCKESP